MYVGLQLRSPTRDRTKTKSLPDFTFARARSYILYSDLSVGTRGNSAVWTEPFWYAVSYFCIELVGFVPMPPSLFLRFLLLRRRSNRVFQQAPLLLFE